MEEAYVDAAKDTAYKGREVGFSDNFTFLHFFEAEDIGVQERLVFRVQLFLCGVEEMQQGSVIVTYRGRR